MANTVRNLILLNLIYINLRISFFVQNRHLLLLIHRISVFVCSPNGISVFIDRRISFFVYCLYLFISILFFCNKRSSYQFIEIKCNTFRNLSVLELLLHSKRLNLTLITKVKGYRIIVYFNIVYPIFIVYDVDT